MGKRIEFDSNARRALWRGVDKLAHAVRVTLGPRGRSVCIQRAGLPAITRDGLAVSREVELADPFENMGVHLIREVAQKTGDDAGDGRATATVLAHRLLDEGLRAVEAGLNPIALKRGIDRGLEAAIASLRRRATPIASHRDLERVATLAAGDRAIGELLAEAVGRAGPHGIVTVEESRGLDTHVDVVEGARFDGGWASPYFVTDADSMEVAFDHPLVMLADSRLQQAAELVPALEAAARMGRPLLVLAEEVEGDALAVMVVNRLRGRVPCVAVSLKGASRPRRELLDDLALLTGATLMAADLGMTPEQFDVSRFGRARHVTIASDHTTLLQGAGRTDDIRARLEAVRRELDEARGEATRERLRDRVARLAGGIAVVRVGAPTEVELHERRTRIEDALAALKAAVEEGVVTGGGVGLLRLERDVRAVSLRGAESSGRDLLLAALADPARQIAENAGESGDAVVSRLRGGTETFGFNAMTGAYADLRADGVMDPAKVLRVALRHAAGMGALVLTTDAIVVDEPEGPDRAA